MLHGHQKSRRGVTVSFFLSSYHIVNSVCCSHALVSGPTRPVNEPLRLEKNGNRLIFPEKGSLVASHDRTKKTHESLHGKYSFSAKIKNGRHGVFINA